jgi:hypothetical protein
MHVIQGVQSFFSVIGGRGPFRPPLVPPLPVAAFNAAAASNTAQEDELGAREKSAATDLAY